MSRNDVVVSFQFGPPRRFVEQRFQLLLEHDEVTGVSRRYSYNGSGQLIQVEQAGTSMTAAAEFVERYEYVHGRLKAAQRTILQPHEISYRYDGADRLIEREATIFKPSVTRYEWDGMRLLSVHRSIFEPFQSELIYNEEGLVIREVRAVGLTGRIFEYDDSNRLLREERVQWRSSRSPQAEDFIIHYTWDELNRLVSVRQAGEDSSLIAFDYCEAS